MKASRSKKSVVGAPAQNGVAGCLAFDSLSPLFSHYRGSFSSYIVVGRWLQSEDINLYNTRGNKVIYIPRWASIKAYRLAINALGIQPVLCYDAVILTAVESV